MNGFVRWVEGFVVVLGCMMSGGSLIGHFDEWSDGDINEFEEGRVERGVGEWLLRKELRVSPGDTGRECPRVGGMRPFPPPEYCHRLVDWIFHDE